MYNAREKYGSTTRIMHIAVANSLWSILINFVNYESIRPKSGNSIKLDVDQILV